MDKIQTELDLLRRHVRLLNAVQEHQPIGIIRLSDKLSLPQHKVRYSLRILEQEGLIEPSQAGARVTGELPAFRRRLAAILDEMVETAEALREKV